MESMKIIINKNGKRDIIQANPGDNLAQCLINNGYMDNLECGRGVCQKCAIKLISGTISSSPNVSYENDKLPKDYILSCVSFLTNKNIEIEIPDVQNDITRKSEISYKIENNININSIIKKIFLELDPPSQTDQRPDIERIISYLGKDISFCPDILKDLPNILRKSNFKITAVLIENKLIQIEPNNTCEELYGFAIDIGSTTVATYLIDMLKGQVLDSVGFSNPQSAFGADVLSRISFCKDIESISKLQESVLAELRLTIMRMLKKNNISSDHVYNIVVVGNTAMSHLFLGVDPTNLAKAPFVPCFCNRISIDARDLDLPINGDARLDVLANISGFVGSDTLGVTMAIRPWEKKGFTLAVDIGTNGEILLAGNGKIWTCSAAAGPAFEGAHITQGMRAGQGAIEKVKLQDGKVDIDIIGNCIPKGICGSGLMDCIGEFLKEKIILPSGSFITEKNFCNHGAYFERLRTGNNGIREFVLVHKGEYGSQKDIVITQKDIREMQLAKAAIAAGIKILCKSAGIDVSQIVNVYLAGAFGNYLNKVSAIRSGLFPNIPIEKIFNIGNAAADGAIRCLLSKTELSESDSIAKSIESIELSVKSEFNDIWLNCLDFPEYD